MHYVIGGLVATAAIIVSELVFNYGLGDFLKDKILSLLGKGEASLKAKL